MTFQFPVLLKLIPLITLVLFLSSNSYGEDQRMAKYAPMGDSVLVFVGQDNEAVGGTKKWRNGYVDNIGVPAGVTHYVYFTEGKSNKFGFEFDRGTVDGLNQETTWGSGPMCMRCYLESDKLAGSVVHLSISMEFDDEELVAKGKYDHNIQELSEFLQEYPHIPFIIRIGYEFDGPWNHYKAKPFKKSWRRIVDKLRADKVTNFATLMASFTMSATRKQWDEYWPGDDYVDWVGYSYWSGGTVSNSETLALAREKGLPVFIAEATPRGFFLNQLNGMVWNDWFQHFFDHIEANKDVIKAISYINTNWDVQPMWRGNGWGNSRIESNKPLQDRWQEKIKQPLYVHTTENTYDLIGFSAKE